jgi:RND family efflux transporter MFP subunit
MADRSSHLDQLKIDRSKPAPSAWRGILIALLAVLFLGGAGGAGWYFLQSNAGIPIHAAMAETLGGGGSGAGLDASGYVVARRQATLSGQVIGKVVFLDAEEGQRVKQGDIIARLDDSNYTAALKQAQAQERQAQAALDDVAPIFERYKRLQGQNAISTDAFENERAAYDAAESALAVAKAAVAVATSNENFTTVRAPFDGVVTNKVAQIGEIVSPAAAGGGDTRTGIATIVDMDSLEVQVDVSENYIDRVTAGQKATIQLTAYPDWDIPASVIAIIPTADQSKGTVKVRVAIGAKDARILPQMGARVSFLTSPQAGPQGPVSHDLSVPPAAVAGDGAAGTVFVIHDDRIEARSVKVGLRTSEAVTILSGLQAGDRVAVGDLGKLHDGDKVTVQE